MDALVLVVGIACLIWVGMLAFGLLAGLYFWLIDPLVRRVRIALFGHRPEA